MSVNNAGEIYEKPSRRRRRQRLPLGAQGLHIYEKINWLKSNGKFENKIQRLRPKHFICRLAVNKLDAPKNDE